MSTLMAAVPLSFYCEKDPFLFCFVPKENITEIRLRQCKEVITIIEIAAGKI
ncbi:MULTISPECIES: hypothetical protein [unclassified Pantoea]|uniref:hypothetical protein n=1 Tax=unclassified Pantoea TaxID=2630326 RepID=UPI001680EF7F|nr:MULTISPECIES: hypothetical protein [unclassified Pantoea]